MKVKVMYYSRSGNTKKVADAIAKKLGQTAEAVPPAYPLENVGLLFLGTGLYGGGIDAKLKEFIRTLDVSKVKNVAIFGTSGGQATGIELAKRLIKEKGIQVVDEVFLCKGRLLTFINRRHPDANDLQNAEKFAETVTAKLQ